MSVAAADTNNPASFSASLASTVARLSASIVGIDDGTRLTASGIVWREDGVIVATSHGVERDDDLTVVAGDGGRHAAHLVGRDHETDIAVLKIDATNLPPVVSEADGPQVGELALAIARPGDDAGVAVTLGLVSARRETETAGHAEYILYTDAVLYPGFSGGALVGAATGNFFGLLNRMYGRGMGVALGAPLVERVVSALLTHGRVPKGYLGIRSQVVALPHSLRVTLSLAQSAGLLITTVEPNTAADKAGLMLGDTLVAISGASVEDVQDLRSHLAAGAEITLTVLRGGARFEIPATVGAEAQH